jgi:hypothetical protein
MAVAVGRAVRTRHQRRARPRSRPNQLERDAIKDEIFRTLQMPLLWLPTTGSGEDGRIRQALDAAEAHWARMSSI